MTDQNVEPSTVETPVTEQPTPEPKTPDTPNTESEQPNMPNMDDVPPHLRIDPIIDFLSKVEISDQLINDMGEACKTLEGFQRFYRSTDLFILNDIKSQVEMWEPEPDNPNYIAFRNLMKWFMYLIATHPWWHRKLCLYNRMMGVNVHSSSYWRLQYHPAYIPGIHWHSENQDATPEQFNKEQMPDNEIYKWIDDNITDNEHLNDDINDEEILKVKPTKGGHHKAKKSKGVQ
jgi:hypothetical protein